MVSAEPPSAAWPSSGFCGLLQSPEAAPWAPGPGFPHALHRSDDGALQFAAWHGQAPWSAMHLDGDQAVLFHGEVHDVEVLRVELGQPAQTGLASLLLQAWRRWGPDLATRLDGVWALAVRDGPRLLLLRDPSGLRDLHASVVGGRVMFATHLNLMACLPGGPPTLTRPALHEYLRLLEIAAPNTVYHGVQSVEEGVPLQWRLGQRAAERPPVQPVAAGASASFEQAVDHLDTLLNQAVAARLADARRPAAFLSGGIDSALLCAIAVRQRPDLVAVTVGFEGADFDESPVAADIAGHLGLQHRVLRFDRAAHLQALTRLGATMEQPMADPSTPSTLLAFEHCREHFDVILDGTGADEAVGLMPPRHARLGVAWFGAWPGPARRALAGVLRTVPPLSGVERLLDFDHPAELLVRWGGFRAHEVAALCGEPVSFAHTRFWRTFERFPRGAHFQRYSALIDAMTCGRLNQALQATAAPVRFPFWHGATNRFLRQLCIDFRSRPGQPKRILRALLARYVPPTIWDTPKRGFTFPLHDFLAGDHHALVRQHLRVERWESQDWLVPEAVEAVGRRFMSGEPGWMFRTWALLVLSVWLEGHGLLPSPTQSACDA